MDRTEFQRRIAVYLDQELPELMAQRDQIAEAVARRVWPLVDSWQVQQEASRELMLWIGQRLQEDWPDAARQLSIEQTGAETGWWPPRRSDKA